MDTLKLRWRLGIILLVVAAVAGGAAGAALVIRYAMNTFAPLETGVTPVPATRTQPKATDLGNIAAAERGTVAFYRAHAGVANELDAALLPADRIGSGAVLTSDGWLVTVAPVLASADQVVAVFSDRSALHIEASSIIRDAATGLVFVHVHSTRLTVSAFGDDTALAPGEIAYGVDPFQATQNAIISGRVLPVENKNDLIESSEKLSRRIAVSGTALALGTVVVNENGEMVGIAESAAKAVPLSFVSDTLRNVFRDRAVRRPVSGIHYVSTDLLATSGSRTVKTGALITAPAKGKALDRGSAGEIAGLKEGDVIIEVEHDRVDSTNTLSELLNQYAPGASLELTVVRAGKEQKINLITK